MLEMFVCNIGCVKIVWGCLEVGNRRAKESSHSYEIFLNCAGDGLDASYVSEPE